MSLITVFNILSTPYQLDLVTRYRSPMPLIVQSTTALLLQENKTKSKKRKIIIIIQPMLQYKWC